MPAKAEFSSVPGSSSMSPSMQMLALCRFRNEFHPCPSKTPNYGKGRATCSTNCRFRIYPLTVEFELFAAFASVVIVAIGSVG